MQLAEEVTNEIEAWLEKFPADQKRSAVVVALLKAQEVNGGWLSEELMNAVAAYLELPAIAVYEVATFYDMFELKPIGKYKMGFCTNVSCALRGSAQVVSAAEQHLGIKMGDTTADGLFTLRETECLGACANAPMCQVSDKQYYEDLTPESVISLIDRLREERVDEK